MLLAEWAGLMYPASAVGTGQPNAGVLAPKVKEQEVEPQDADMEG